MAALLHINQDFVPVAMLVRQIYRAFRIIHTECVEKGPQLLATLIDLLWV
jgi:hypothetical protein